MGLFNMFKKDEDQGPSLQDERDAGISNAKNEMYNTCLGKLERQISEFYKSNQNSCYITVSRPRGVRLDDDTQHKVLTKATYDAFESVGIRPSKKPNVQKVPVGWSVEVYWN